MPVRKQRKSRGNDREQRQKSRLDHQVDAWDEVRRRYPPEVVAMVDGIADRSLTYADIQRLELLDYFRLDMLIAKYLAEPKSGTAVTALQSVRLQSRKHMRVIIAAQGPALTANDLPVRLPIGMTEPELRAAVAEILDDEILS